MNCPLFINFKKTCEKKVSFVPHYCIEICTTDKHKDCPFYIICTKSGFICEFSSFCPAFQYLLNKDFNKFCEVAKEYCLCLEKRDSCERYKIRKSQQIPPENLLPDGSFFPIEKK